MVTKQRVFSNDKTIHYDDYLKIKQGTECLKSIKADNRTKNDTMNQFANYDQFMTLSKAFYKHTNINKYNNEPVANLCNANDSYIQHNQNTLNHPTPVCNSHVLYPYGHGEAQQPHNLYFPYKLDMNKWCADNKKCVTEPTQHNPCNNNPCNNNPVINNPVINNPCNNNPVINNPVINNPCNNNPVINNPVINNPVINNPYPYKINHKTTTIPGIVNNDQGFFQNKSNIDITCIPIVDFLKNNPSIDITRIPVVYLAYLSNISMINGAEADDSDVSINLNPICLKWSDFITLFFRSPGGVFGIPSHSTSLALTLLNQTYETTQNQYVKFSLQDQIRKAWSKKNAKNEAFIPANINIVLNKTGFLTKSLTSVKEYCLGLSLDEAISSLLNNVDIIPGSSDTTATVKFTITYKNYFEPLNTCVLINFAYITKIPCYQNYTDCFIQGYSDNSNECKNCNDPLNKTDSSSSSKISPSYTPDKKCKTGLCKNAKQLFI